MPRCHRHHRRPRRLLALSALIVTLMSCEGGSVGEPRAEAGPRAIHLVDCLSESRIDGTELTPPPAPPLTIWRFDEGSVRGGAVAATAGEADGQAADARSDRDGLPAEDAGADTAAPGPALAGTTASRTPNLGWQAGPGVDDLRVTDGLLMGTSRDDFPVLHAERTLLAQPDVLDAVEVRMRVSAGANLWFGASAEEHVDPAAFRDWWATQQPMTTPIVPGDELRTYRLVPPVELGSRLLRHLILRPTDAADATFAIESLRLVWRREQLAELEGGVTWQGQGEIYRETLLARAPQTLHFDLALPARPRFDVSLGMVTLEPVTYTIAVTPRDGRRAPTGNGTPSTSGDASAGETDASTVVHRRTLSMAGTWEDVSVDLQPWAGQDVTLSLGLDSDVPGQIGLWGGPVVRAAHPPADDARPQGVILVMCDTLRADHLELYGYERATAPHLTRLAGEGVTFTSCYSQATWTKASSASLLTSLYPTTHRVTDIGMRLPASAVTLAEVFRDAGYATVSLSSILFTGKFSNLQQGFEVVHEATSLPPQRRSKTALPYLNRLTPWLEKHRDEPFFVFLHVFDPHDPYAPQTPFDQRWASAEAGAEQQRLYEQVGPYIAHPALQRLGMATSEEVAAAGVASDVYVETLEDWYDGSIRAMDVELGRLLETLQNLGLHERTLVVFTSDHGEEFLDHGRMFHGQGVYAELNHVPLVVHWPGKLPAGRTVDEVVQSIDIMPTLLELAGLTTPSVAQGQSLVPLLGGPAPAAPWHGRPAVTVKAATDNSVPPPRLTEAYAYLTDDWKLVYHVHREQGRTTLELFDRRNDPTDAHDLAAEHPDVVARLRDGLIDWQQASLGVVLPSDDETSDVLGSDELVRMRALGYVR